MWCSYHRLVLLLFLDRHHKKSSRNCTTSQNRLNPQRHASSEHGRVWRESTINIHHQVPSKIETSQGSQLPVSRRRVFKNVSREHYSLEETTLFSPTIKVFIIRRTHNGRIHLQPSILGLRFERA